MIRRSLLGLLLAAALLPSAGEAAPRRRHAAAPPVRVRIDTSYGPIVIELEMKRAPITCANFLRYVDAKKFDGTDFYRAARGERNPKEGLVQGGVNHDGTRSFFPIKLEPTSKTGLRHVNGTVSMARNDPNTAMGDFFIVLGDGSYLDASPGYPGYAAFGHVLSGMAVASRILAEPTFPGGWSADTVGQSIRKPVKIVDVKRVP